MPSKNGKPHNQHAKEFLLSVRKGPGRPTALSNGAAAIAGHSTAAKRLLSKKRHGKTWEQIADELSTEEEKISAGLVWKVANGRCRSRRVNMALRRGSKPYPRYAKIRLDDIEQVRRQLNKHWPNYALIKRDE